MGGIGAWFRNLGAKIATGFRNFMTGRYGNDKLNLFILCAAAVISVATMFIPVKPVTLILTMLAYGLMFWAIFRSFSRNTYKRYQENRRFLLIFERIKDREHKHFDCPKCRQPVRVPRKKGKIAITCPKCGEKFIRKT